MLHRQIVCYIVGLGRCKHFPTCFILAKYQSRQVKPDFTSSYHTRIYIPERNIGEENADKTVLQSQAYTLHLEHCGQQTRCCWIYLNLGSGPKVIEPLQWLPLSCGTAFHCILDQPRLWRLSSRCSKLSCSRWLLDLVESGTLWLCTVTYCCVYFLLYFVTLFLVHFIVF